MPPDSVLSLTSESETLIRWLMTWGGQWGILVYENVADQLMTIQAENHNNRAVQGSRPLLVLDVWKHAYYLQYEKDSSSYIDNWWNVVAWDNVAMQYERAREGHGA